MRFYSSLWLYEDEFGKHLGSRCRLLRDCDKAIRVIDSF